VATRGDPTPPYRTPLTLWRGRGKVTTKEVARAYGNALGTPKVEHTKCAWTTPGRGPYRTLPHARKLSGGRIG